MTKNAKDDTGEQQPLEFRAGHLAQVRARLEEDRVRIEKQRRKHSFGRGTSDHGPAVPIWSGSVEEAEVLHAMLDKLLNPEQYPHEVNYAKD